MSFNRFLIRINGRRLSLRLFLLSFFFRFRLLRIRYGLSFVRTCSRGGRRRRNRSGCTPSNMDTCRMDDFFLNAFSIRSNGLRIFFLRIRFDLGSKRAILVMLIIWFLVNLVYLRRRLVDWLSIISPTFCFNRYGRSFKWRTKEVLSNGINYFRSMIAYLGRKIHVVRWRMAVWMLWVHGVDLVIYHILVTRNFPMMLRHLPKLSYVPQCSNVLHMNRWLRTIKRFQARFLSNRFWHVRYLSELLIIDWRGNVITWSICFPSTVIGNGYINL